MLSLVYRHTALADLDAIYSYIEPDNPRRAASFVQEIRDRRRTLCVHPKLGRARDDLSPGIRILPMLGRIVVAYRVTPSDVLITRFSQAARITRRSCSAKKLLAKGPIYKPYLFASRVRETHITSHPHRDGSYSSHGNWRAAMTAAEIESVLTGSHPANAVSMMDRLAAIPEEDIWLAKQKSALTRRAYRLDVRHFMATLGIADADELRRVDHRAVIAWERAMREVERAAPATIRRRMSALSSLFKHLVRLDSVHKELTWLRG